ncbi:OmpA family protein [Akkermansiaceae bacterium]|nr:OmpA family protein [Akkermansiaceae bacterium]
MMKLTLQSSILFSLVAAFSISSCTTNAYTGNQQLSKTAAGGLIGAAGGALVGVAAASGQSGDKVRKKALTGALIGGVTGGGLGLYMDNQEAQIRKQLQGTGVSVTRSGNDIILNMPSDITFPVNQSAILPKFQSTLTSVALVLSKYNKTSISITGHTDSDGSSEYNQTLSSKRAYSVAQFLNSKQVSASRIQTYGRGESAPVASNSTSVGKAKNRRVELKIVPQSSQFN